MSTLGPDQWQEVSPYIDEVLDVAPEKRAAWLLDLEKKDAPLASLLKILLNEQQQLQQEGFLENSVLHAGTGLAGQKIGAYTLLSQLGEGGMGSVWLAQRSDGRFERQAAVKFVRLTLSGHATEQRFKREGSILGRLTHPHIAELLDAGISADGNPYLVLEYVDGVPIDQYCDEHKLDVEARVRLFLDVLSAVAEAHANLIVHRDIKPSNVLVRSDGQVKLLDFGIAKLLAQEGDTSATILTMEGGGALTPRFAAPEQVTGGTVTTATDVYALGLLLYLLLTGQHPAGTSANSPAELVKAIVELEAPRASATVSAESAATAKLNTTPERLRRQLRGDLDTILGKALKKNPQERYGSVTALADDLRRYLKHEAISVRPDTLAYRTTKFVSRNRTAVALGTTAIALVIGSLTTGLLIANQQRKIAEHRFLQVRQLANQFLALDTIVQTLPGSTQARHQIVSTALNYLQALSSEVHNDRALALEVGTAYLQVARVQGLPTSSNLGEFNAADESLAKGEKFIDEILRADPRNRNALLTSAEIAHDRMILATGGPREDVVAQARKTTGRAELFLSIGNPTPEEIATVAQLFMNVGNSYNQLHLFDDAITTLRRGIEISKPIDSAQRIRAIGLSRLASGLRDSGDLDGALQSISEAETALQTATFPSEMQQSWTTAMILSRKGSILGEDGQPNLNRPEEAVVALREAFDITEKLAAQDPNDSRSRYAEMENGKELAAIVSHYDPKQALAIYDRAIARVRETKDSVNRKGNEASCLAGSALTLLRLRRPDAAKQRIDAALLLLKAKGSYPAEKLDPAAFQTLRALAAYQEQIGQRKTAVQTYEEILNKSLASNPNPQADLGSAYALSRAMAQLADAYSRTGESAKAQALTRNRQALWRHWLDSHPNNAFFRKQLEAASP